MTRLLRLLFDWLYGPFAWTYDAVAWLVSAGQWRTWQRAVLPLLPAGPVLEIAHGTGNLLADLLAQGRPAIGLDRSPQMGRIARRKLLRRAPLPSAPLLRADARALPFAAGCFPAVVATFPAEFIADPRSAREAARVLAPGGRLVGALGAWITGNSLPDRAARLLFRLFGQAAPDLPERLLAPFRAIEWRAARFEAVALPRSRVQVLIAEK